MNIWTQTLKRTLLALIAVVLAFAWSDTGHAQSPCFVQRAQDPLDVLNSGLRHNVWLLLDTSGSMRDPPSGGGLRKIDQAKKWLGAKTETEAIERALDLLVAEATINRALKKLGGQGRLQKVYA